MMRRLAAVPLLVRAFVRMFNPVFVRMFVRMSVRMSICMLASLAAGCERAAQDMYDQAKLRPFTPSDLFADGNASRPPPDGAMPAAGGPFADTSSGRLGADTIAADTATRAAQRDPAPLTLARLQRGRDRYQIYCMPCHSPVGDGDGLVVRRGFPTPPTFHSDRLRQVADRHVFDVITNGYGVMPSYAAQLGPDDRWAIVDYLRALQRSQHVAVETLPPEARARLEREDAP